MPQLARSGLVLPALLVLFPLPGRTQTAADLQAVHAPPAWAGIYRAATGEFVPAGGGSSPTMVGSFVVYNNTVPSSTTNFIDPADYLIDTARVPSTSSQPTTGTQDSYRITSFEFGYCTTLRDPAAGGPGAALSVCFHQHKAECNSGAPGTSALHLGPPAVACFELTGLPGSPDGSTLTCHYVTVDLTGTEFCLVGDADGVFDGTPGLDTFGVTIQNLDDIRNYILMGGDLVACPGGDGTVFQNPAGCDGAGSGTGLGATSTISRQSFNEQGEASSISCTFFGNLNPYLRLWSDLSGECAGCPLDDAYEENDTLSTAVQPFRRSNIPHLLLLDGDEDAYVYRVLVGLRLIVDAYFVHSDVDLDLYLTSLDGSVVYDTSLTTTDDERIVWNNPFQHDEWVLLRAVTGIDGSATGCGSYELDFNMNSTPCTQPDAFEPNDTCATAVAVGPGHIQNLRISPGQRDWFLVTVPPQSSATIEIRGHNNGPGAPDFVVWSDDCQNQLALPMPFPGGLRAIVDNPGVLPLAVRVEAIPVATGCRAYDLTVELDEPGMSYCSSVPNTSGVASRIWASGSSSIVMNSLDLLATGTLPGQAAVFFHGPGEQIVPFGNGLRCVAPPIVRSSVILANGMGHVAWSPDLRNTPGIDSGAARYFQCWYRDPSDPFGFNLSDGYVIEFH